MKRYIDAATLAFRCEAAGLTGIYKSYIRNIKVADYRREPGWFLAEIDFSFTHKGKKYICKAETIGDKRYSARQKYTVEEVKSE